MGSCLSEAGHEVWLINRRADHVDAMNAYGLTIRVDGFFNVSDGWVTCPELEDYRLHLKEIRAKQSSGGKKGAAKTNAGKSQVSRESVVKLNTVQPSTAQSNSVINDREYIDKSWDEYRNESDD